MQKKTYVSLTKAFPSTDFSGREPRKPKKIPTKLENVRENLIGKIKKALSILNIDSFDVMDYEVEGAPIIFEDKYDDNNTFTLDRVEICKNGNLQIEASSCASSCTVAQDRIPTDALAGIAEMFEDNLDDFLQRLIEDKCTDSDISDAESFLWNHFGECAFSDEKIDNGLDENPEGDKYLMMRSYDLPGGAHIRLYFGDNSRTVTCVEGLMECSLYENENKPAAPAPDPMNELRAVLKNLKDIRESGWIPFASPCPSSTEAALKREVDAAIGHLEKATTIDC